MNLKIVNFRQYFDHFVIEKNSISGRFQFFLGVASEFLGIVFDLKKPTVSWIFSFKLINGHN